MKNVESPPCWLPPVCQEWSGLRKECNRGQSFVEEWGLSWIRLKNGLFLELPSVEERPREVWTQLRRKRVDGGFSLSPLRTSSSEPHNERGEVILKYPKVWGDNWNLDSITQTKAQHSHFLCPMTFKCINGYNFTSSWRARMEKKNQIKEWRITSAWQEIKIYRIQSM